ncbi:uncharacterized protein LOC106738241 [Alligator mississippiensis]|uniref:uncharacterized protein LOC106738241 n=1 Tax=Alligator mississippiensis TaxID=8496 RepID=UPI002877E7EA|nr:uncharacterized protein LOC106738241 [Alligator mississippiensis]
MLGPSCSPGATSTSTGSAVLAVDGVMNPTMDHNKLNPSSLVLGWGAQTPGFLFGGVLPGLVGGGLGRLGSLGEGQGSIQPPWKFPRGAPPPIPQDVLVWAVTSGRGSPSAGSAPWRRSGAAWPEQKQQRPGLQRGAEDPRRPRPCGRRVEAGARFLAQLLMRGIPGGTEELGAHLATALSQRYHSHWYPGPAGPWPGLQVYPHRGRDTGRCSSGGGCPGRRAGLGHANAAPRPRPLDRPWRGQLQAG